MSAIFDGGSHLVKTIAGLTAPYSLVIWFKGSWAGTAFGPGSSSADSYGGLEPWNDNVFYFTIRETGSETFATGPSFTPGVWNLGVVLAASTSSRIARVNSTSGSAQTSTKTPTFDRLVVGSRMLSGSFSQPWEGNLAHACAYNVLLDSTDLTDLLTKAPNLVHASAIVDYESLISGAGTYTNSGATFDAGDNPTLDLGGTVTIMRPDATSAAGNWLTNLGGSDLHTAVNEAGSPIGSSYIISGVNPVADVCKLGLNNLTITPTSLSFRYEYYKSETGGTGVLNLRARLLEGTTERGIWTHSDIGTGSVIAQQTVSGAAFTAITDRDNLFVEFCANP
jgi:hypothetical protein